MKILDKMELMKQPNGTVFMLYEPEILSGRIHILTGRYTYRHGWNGELTLDPFWDFECNSNNKERYTQWSTVDSSDIDYDDSQLFAVFSIKEIKQMINCLNWSVKALIGKNPKFINQDIWFLNDKTITDEEFDKLKREGKLYD